MRKSSGWFEASHKVFFPTGANPIENVFPEQIAKNKKTICCQIKIHNHLLFVIYDRQESVARKWILK